MKKKTKQLMGGVAAVALFLYWKKKKGSTGASIGSNGSMADWAGFFKETPTAGGWYTPDSWGNADGSNMSQANFLQVAIPGVTGNDMQKWLLGTPTEPHGYTDQDKMLIEQVYDTPADLRAAM